jgi:hypothetical protein
MPPIKPYVSLKPLKQWCKARNIDFNSYLYSLSFSQCMSARIFRPKLEMPKVKLTLWEKIKNFLRY